MKKLILLLFIPLASCSNLSSDAQEVCEIMNETEEIVQKLDYSDLLFEAWGNEDKAKEYEDLESKLEELYTKIDAIKTKYDEDEFQSYLLENCEIAKELKELGKAFEEFETDGPTEFFNTCESEVLIEKARWGKGKNKVMEEILMENLNNETLNPSGYIFYKRYKSPQKNIERIIKFGPLKISKSVYNQIKTEDLKLNWGNIINESITLRGRDIYREAERKYFESIKNEINDSIITVPIKLDLRID